MDKPANFAHTPKLILIVLCLSMFANFVFLLILTGSVQTRKNDIYRIANLEDEVAELKSDLANEHAKFMRLEMANQDLQRQLREFEEAPTE